MPHQGLHLKLSNRPDILARMSRDDVNMPDFDGATIHQQVPEVKFEAAVYQLLRSEPNIVVSRLLYHRIPVQHPGSRLHLPQDITGRQLFLFERAEGENNRWREFSSEQKVRAHVSKLCSARFQLTMPTVGLPSCSDSSYSCFIVQFQPPARLRHGLASRATLRTEAQILSHPCRSYSRLLRRSIHVQGGSNDQEYRRHDWVGE